MHIVEDLDGTTIARAYAEDETVSLTLLAASGFSDGKYYPAESVTLTGRTAVERLYAILGDALKEGV